MNKRVIAIILVFVLLFAIVSYAAKKAWALNDPFSFATLGGLSYALGSYWGIEFSAANATGLGMQEFMSQELGNYVSGSGQSITELFGAEAARIVAGKLIVGHQLYNGIKSFIDWMRDKFGITGDLSAEFQDHVLPWDNPGQESMTGVGLEVIFSGSGVGSTAYEVKGYYNGVRKFYRTRRDLSGGILRQSNIFLKNGSVYATVTQVDRDEQVIGVEEFLMLSGAELDEFLSWDGSGYVNPTVLNPDKEWSGTIGGEDWPDTNLDELIGTIYQDIGLNDIQVDGEVIDVPVPPEPTPAPIDPDIPLQDVPWEGLNDLIGKTGTDITGSIEDAASDITGALDGLSEQTAEGVQDITGAIEGVQEGVAGLTDTIEEALTAPEIDEKTFDLRELFPFCIPFDIYHLLQKFDGSPTAPHVQLPIVIPSIGFSYTLDLDFSSWDPVAAAMRTVELIVYALGLAWATSKVIKW